MSIAGEKANLRNLAAGDMTKFQEGPSMNHGYESCTLAGKGSLGEFGGGGFATVPFSDGLHAREELQPVDLFRVYNFITHSFKNCLLSTYYTPGFGILCAILNMVDSALRANSKCCFQASS